MLASAALISASKSSPSAWSILRYLRYAARYSLYATGWKSNIGGGLVVIPEPGTSTDFFPGDSYGGILIELLDSAQQFLIELLLRLFDVAVGTTEALDQPRRDLRPVRLAQCERRRQHSAEG